MAKKTNPSPPDIQIPGQQPEIRPPADPEEPLVPEEDPEILPDEDPDYIPSTPHEIPPPGEGP